MAKQNASDRPITIGDVNKFRRNYIKGAMPVLLFCGILLLLLGIGILFLGVSGSNAFLTSVVFILFGLVFVGGFFWAKKKVKDINA